ncbi:hypothetical protein [Arthrobacter zhaoguopingii]|uniref:hypothetical protein n=1 Tax=Arthrobacter zhaoguopingii TaxID=2681491 RepID=UPI00135A77ED|nr:hypothetical protein [Arthrobacter zhaoguopingii]
MAHVDAFMEAYAGVSGSLSAQQEPTKIIKITQVPHPGIPAAPECERRAVHRSKHPRWSFDATAHSDRPGWWFWEGRDFGVRSDPPSDYVGDDLRAVEKWSFAVLSDGDRAAAGEALFHLLRSLALVVRGVRGTRLLHASGIVRPRDGNAVLFTGAVSAGKTTLMTNAVLEHGVVPLTNDRAWIHLSNNDGAPPRVHTWPSYASFCEGTLLGYPQLEEAALAFEHGESLLRVSPNSQPLRPLFDKDSKRIYPMSWFTNAVDVRFAAEAELGVIALSRVDPTLDEPSLRELNPLHDQRDHDEIVAVLLSEQFDTSEPSFLQWHGLALDKDPIDVEDLVQGCARSGVRFVALSLRPSDLSVLRDLL